MTMRVALHLDGDSSGAKKAVRETTLEMGKLDKSAKAVNKSVKMTNTGIVKFGGAAGAIKLNNQQLMNMQFQMNDMATMLASGQNPFVMIMQQGMQIGQIFGPGGSDSPALKATGTGILSFLTNPINLFIAGTAVAAGSIPLLWNALNGPEAKSAKDTMEDFSEFVKGLDNDYDAAAAAARRFMEEARSPNVVAAQAKAQVEDIANAYKVAMSELSDSIFIKSAQMFPIGAFPEEIQELRNMARQIDAGTLSAKEFQDQLAQITLDPDITSSASKLADYVSDAADSATDLAQNLSGSEAAFDVLTGKSDALASALSRAAVALANQSQDLSRLGMSDPERGKDLRLDYLRGQERLAKEAEREARLAQQRAAKREANAFMLADLEAEIAALNSSSDMREHLLAQLQSEQDLRSAIASLGKEATAEEIAQLQILIPLRNQALENSKLNEQQMRAEEHSTNRLASSLAGMARQLLLGADAGQMFGNMLANAGSRLLEFGFQTLLGGMGGGNPLMSLLFSANGNIFDNGQVMAFANGGVVDRPTLFPMTSGIGMMGEAGPEAIMPLSRGKDGKLGVNMNSGGNSIVELHMAPDVEARVLRQAAGQSVRIVRSATPVIAGQGAVQGAALAKDDYARSTWGKI